MALPTLAQVKSRYLAFEKRHLGGIIDTDHYPPKNPYQCADVPKAYGHEEYGLVLGAWGDAAEYWTNTHPEVLKAFYKVKGSAAQQGDIVPLTGKTSAGHIGIATGRVTATQIEILEQNGYNGDGHGTGGNRIRKRFVDRSRVLGLLRPRIAVPTPKPKPTPAGMPRVNSVITLVAPVNRTTFKNGTTTVVGHLRFRTNESYTVRGYDKNYKGRILINSKSAGGNGVALALYYTNGQRIPGWR